MTQLRNYPLAKFYAAHWSFDHQGEGNKENKQFLRAELTAGIFLSLNFYRGFEKTISSFKEVGFDEHTRALALLEGLGFVLPTVAAAAGAATCGTLFLKPVIEKVLEDAMGATATEAVKLGITIPIIAIGSALAGIIVGVAVKNLVAAIICAIEDSKEIV